MLTPDSGYGVLRADYAERIGRQRSAIGIQHKRLVRAKAATFVWPREAEERSDCAIAEAEQSGRYLPFCFNSSGNDYLQGSCYVEPGDSVEVADAKIRRFSL
jgi:hypothetical protein